jgi:hypothetical protein
MQQSANGVTTNYQDIARTKRCDVRMPDGRKYILTSVSKLRLSSAGSLAYTHCTFFMVSGSMNGETHFHRPLQHDAGA